MCGIVGIVGRGPVAPMLVDALKRLEYRGYDSAGVATVDGGRLDRRRAEGKLAGLEKRLADEPLAGAIGIGHTRWATHGAPTENNAHPHFAGERRRRPQRHHRELRARSRPNSSPTASTSAPRPTRRWSPGSSHICSSRATIRSRRCWRRLQRLEGAYALAVLFADHDDMIIGARNGPPLAVGYGDGEMYLGSDAIALAPFTNDIAYLEDGDWTVVTRQGAEFFDHAGRSGRARAAQVGRHDVPCRQGQPPPFHGKGDLRAARGDRPYA